MSEIFVILVIAGVALAARMGAGGHVRRPIHCAARHEIERLHYQAGWLAERLELARQENWDEALIANLEAELEATRRQWLRLTSRH